MSLKQHAVDIWRPNFERMSLEQVFKPIFTRFIGVENPREYPNILATLMAKDSEYPSQVIIFDGNIPLAVTDDLSMIQSAVKQELVTIDVARLNQGEPIIRLFVDDRTNQRFLDALAHITQKAIENEHFLNDNIRNNFITKMVTYMYLYVKDMTFDDQFANKCIYYGSITKHEFYFISMLHLFAFDVLYINPKEDVNFTFDTLSQLSRDGAPQEIKSFVEYAQSGQVIEQVNSVLTGFSEQVESTLFSEDSGNYRPWQFRRGTTKSLFFNATLIDLTNNWNEAAKLRTGFSVSNSVVSVPHFFFEIEGRYEDFSEYHRLYDLTKSPKNAIIVTSNDELATPSTNREEILKLAFALNQNGSINHNILKESPLYQYERYNDETERFMIDKMAELINDKTLLVKDDVDKKFSLEILAVCLSLSEQIIRQIDNFDYPHAIPKLVMFCDVDQPITERNAIVLAFLNVIGFDIVIYSPSGQTNLSSYVNQSRFTSTRLETVDYELSHHELQKPFKAKSGGIFSKLFG